MSERGRNILPMIGFIMIVVLLLGGFALAKGISGRKLLEQDKNTDSNKADRLLPEEDGKGIFFSKYAVSESEEMSTYGVDKITIESVNSKINIYLSESDKINAKYYGNVEASNKETTPHLEVIMEGKEAIAKVKYPMWLNSSFFEQTTLDVTIPANWAGDLNIRNTSGNISAKELKGKDISIITISGAISADELIGGDIEIKSTSGAITVSKLSASGILSGSTMSGKYTVNSIDCRKVELESISGTVALNDVSCDNIYAKNISGSVDIAMKNGNADIETTSGTIKAKFIDGFDTIKAKSISGEVTLNIPENSQFKADIKTISGSINCNDFPIKVDLRKENVLKGTAGNGDSQININTASGGVKIKKN